MRDIFNKLGGISRAFDALKTAFAVAKSGVNMDNITNAMSTLNSKTDNFVEAVEKESSQARLIFAKNIFFITPEGTLNLPKTWNGFFDVLKTGLAKTETAVSALNNPEETASLGRIRYRAEIFQSWYQAQDPRLLPLFESLGKINGIHNELTRLLPKGKHEWEVKGKSMTVEIS